MSATVMRRIVRIDPDKCDGCGQCVPSCAEAAIQIIDGKARLVGENLCDGLGACLGTCPRDAIAVEERPAEKFDPRAVELRKSKVQSEPSHPGSGACPGMMARVFDKKRSAQPTSGQPERASQLGQWPVQLALVPSTGQMWQDADVLITADCVPFAMADFHEKLLSGKTVAVACPKLDDLQSHVDKLTAIFAGNSIKSVTVARMDVPCCMGIVYAVKTALAEANRTDIPLNEVTVAIDGSTKCQ